jgi:hypothetical protein
VTVALALAACSNMGYKPPPEPDPQLRPDDYRKQIIEMMPKLIEDPSGMRDTGITELALTPVGSSTLYAACVRYRPRKSRTEYDTLQERLAVFHGGSLAQFVLASSGQCAKAAYRPFPELEKLCFGDRCPRQ